jgi:hypothetical protein
MTNNLKLAQQAYERGYEIGTADAVVGMFTLEDTEPWDYVSELWLVAIVFGDNDNPNGDEKVKAGLIAMFENGYTQGYDEIAGLLAK